MVKKYIKINVYKAALKRLEYLFNEFEQLVIAFSGGKDSGVMLNLVIDYATEHNLLHKVVVYHLDYETQYQMTSDYVESTFLLLPKEVTKHWLCLPIKVTCTTSMFQSFWTPWENGITWIREMPKYDFVINEDNVKFDYNAWDYTVQDNYNSWISKGVKTCVLIGIRTQESLHRQSAITSQRKVNRYDNKSWLIDKGTFVNAYPIYDFETEDIWGVNAKNNYSYNKIYDLFYKAGLSIHQMRVASPFIEQGQGSLKLYKVLDPDNWGKMISRVNGVNFTGLYGGTTAMGWKNITKPNHFTWEEYMYFLLDTLPIGTKNNYLKKLEVSKKFWKEKGGVLSEDIIQVLEEKEIDFSLGDSSNYKTDKKPVKFNEYLDDIDISDFKSIPTYKRMCVCIMKNDHLCKYMGFSQTKEELKRRNEVIKRWENL